MSDSDEKRNLVAIVTAAGRGIGAACARELSARRYRLGLMSPSGSAEKLAGELGAVGLTGSVTEPEDLAALVERTVEAYGRIDAAVVNTGHPPKGELLEIDDEAWRGGFNLCFLHFVRLARLIVPRMQETGGGSIVAISTFGAVEPSAAFPVSSTIRAALAAYVKLLADRCAADAIRVNAVLPGFVDTFPVDPDRLELIPMRRYARVEEVARTVAFLLSDDAGYITGQSIRIDGGATRSL